MAAAAGHSGLLSRGKKLVHLDLKGAPPTVEHLRQLVHTFADLGADGLLVEYEDTFPYEGELRVLRSTAHAHYSREEIVSIQDVAKARGLEVVPLVQTFGHLEFVLKHAAFRRLREVDHCLGTLNPHSEQAVQLVLEMLRQVAELHPGSGRLHLGADEVYLLGQGEESVRWLSGPGRSVHQLFLGHVVTVAKAVRERFPHLDLIVWDDMLRDLSVETLKGSGLAGLVQPMLWDYQPSLDVERTVLLMEKYQAAGLSDQWAASSFKGSTSVHCCVTSTQRHVENHLQWLRVASALPSGVRLRGVALTGWQRYDHLSVLCELMPVAVPSLASCLQTLHHGTFSQEAQTNVMDALQIPSTEVEDIIRLDPAGSPSYPGWRLAQLVVKLAALLQSEDLRLLDGNMFVRGWFSPYHRQRKTVNPLVGPQIQTHVALLLEPVRTTVDELRQEMGRLYPPATVEEWIEQHVTPVVAPVQALLRDLDISMEEMGLFRPGPASSQ
ncbi:hexosaminidase D isoform X2 [Denticeps clupeoides]|uniref:beta-N-acetylhexosaminidase n=1 Tax=Denticeps clupeoides TaxID=299321 RepID=A0AAY4D8N2_9TELE|nr:hexosaminidase D-like isoform X2 [Denticeps clupeoides]